MEEVKLLEIVGNNIREIRKEKKLRQVDVADKCDMESTNLIRIEKGRTNPTTYTLYKLSKALNVDICDFFKGI